MVAAATEKQAIHSTVDNVANSTCKNKEMPNMTKTNLFTRMTYR